MRDSKQKVQDSKLGSSSKDLSKNCDVTEGVGSSSGRTSNSDGQRGEKGNFSDSSRVTPENRSTVEEGNRSTSSSTDDRSERSRSKSVKNDKSNTGSDGSGRDDSR